MFLHTFRVVEEIWDFITNNFGVSLVFAPVKERVSEIVSYDSDNTDVDSNYSCTIQDDIIIWELHLPIFQDWTSYKKKLKGCYIIVKVNNDLNKQFVIEKHNLCSEAKTWWVYYNRRNYFGKIWNINWKDITLEVSFLETAVTWVTLISFVRTNIDPKYFYIIEDWIRFICEDDEKDILDYYNLESKLG